MRLLTTLVLLALGLPVALAAEKAYYTWVDKNGVTNFSERQPKDQEATYMTPELRFGYKRPEPTSKGPATGPAEGADTKSEQTEAPATDPLAADRAAVDQEIARAKASNCEIARRNLAKLEAFARIRVKGDDGQERMLTDEEKQQRIQQERLLVSENCQPGS